jgi:hypothetical protein
MDTLLPACGGLRMNMAGGTEIVRRGGFNGLPQSEKNNRSCNQADKKPQPNSLPHKPQIRAVKIIKKRITKSHVKSEHSL